MTRKRKKRATAPTVDPRGVAFNSQQVAALLGVPRTIGTALTMRYGFHATGAGYIWPREELLKWVKGQMRRRRTTLRKREMASASRRLRDAMME